jgi:hypothetical protein
MNAVPFLVLLAAIAAAVAGRLLRPRRHDPLAARLVAAVCAVAAVVAAATGALVPAGVLLMSAVVLLRRALVA